MGQQALCAYSGNELIYIGENANGCTADEDFYYVLGSDWQLVAGSGRHINFMGLNSEVGHYRRRYASWSPVVYVQSWS